MRLWWIEAIEQVLLITTIFFDCALFGPERTELLTNLLTLGITNVNLSLLLIGCDDYDEVK